jgi:hypothetical protein
MFAIRNSFLPRITNIEQGIINFEVKTNLISSDV